MAGRTGPLPPDDLRRNLAIADAEGSGKYPHLGIAGDTYTILLTGEDTGGQFCLIDMHVPQGGGPPLHRHDFEETFIIQQGELELTFRGQTKIVREGMTVNIPSNAPHRFHNNSSAPARMLCLCSPAGQERFFMEVGVPVPTRTTPAPPPNPAELERLQQHVRDLAPKYRTELL